MRKFISYILIVLMVFGTGLVDWQKVSAQSKDELEQKIQNKKNEQAEIEKEKSELQDDKQETEEKIEENLDQQESVNSEIDTIDQELSSTREKIEAKENEIADTNAQLDELSNQIDELNSEIEQLKEDIRELKERIEKREELLKDRLRAIQSNGGSMNYIEVIFGAKSFGEFISRSSAVNTIMKQDKDIMETHKREKQEVEAKQAEVKDKKQDIEQKKAEVEDKKASLTNQKDELESLKSQLSEQMAEKEDKLSELEESEEELHQHKMSLEEEQQVLRDQAEVIEKAMKEAKQDLDQLSKPSPSNGSNGSDSSNGSGSNLSAGGTGIFDWPVNGRFSSPYGPRDMGSGYHYGIDIAASTGTTIQTAAPGVVTRSDYSNSYGNVVYVYHPQHDKTTVYAHMSQRSVSLGQSVSAGQKLGAVGNTGNSYGAHLHFEVHNGEWAYHGGVNPMSFLP
ncbi:PcsB-like coiled-coil domain-containing protein [Lentibacillus sp.]|uniref:PcsB-like coiled-coil domain-containing protein n=1 Tax=Lentibacillus sp. TaxID=1925746 RepID=UPI002B4B8CF3|nr:peptidoglycan DD-metalloendopeptidase family protein [Lentibacillus sp.]HLS09717.1 peptidoglycan DD-metalloendopeptidase family protein [Lentibacillus sp.]